MQYILYKLTNLINNKIYIGVHKTDNLEDGYMGSGYAIINAVKKYGKENFKKTILNKFTSEEDAYAAERSLVTEEFVSRLDTYNIQLGGRGRASRQMVNKRSDTWRRNGIGRGSRNSQYGTCWIKHHQYGNKKVHKDNLEIWLNQGWVKGRALPPGWGDNIRNKLEGRTLEDILGPDRGSERRKEISEALKARHRANRAAKSS